VDIRRADVKEVSVMYKGQRLPEARITGIQAGVTYELTVFVPL